MLAHRIIPVVLCRGRQAIKGRRFDSWRSVGLAAQACSVHAARGIDELILLDIGATPEGRGPDLELVRELSECCFMPLTVGGGVRSVEDVDALLRAGADKVAMCTAALGGERLISDIAGRFGSQCLVVAIDVKDTGPAKFAFGDCGKFETWWEPPLLAILCEKAGAGEILLTSIDREGTLDGYDLDMIRAVSEAVSIPVVANGGCGSYAHMAEAIEAGADAVAAGAMFQFCEATPRGAAEYLHEHDIEVRL